MWHEIYLSGWKKPANREKSFKIHVYVILDVRCTCTLTSGEKGGKGGARLLRDCLQEDDKEEPGWGSVVVGVDTLS
jgi:hypothetical protein